MNSSKSLNTVVEDIYSAIAKLSDGEDIQIPTELVDEFGESMKAALLHWATPRTQSKGLRMSNIGKPSRQLWYDIKEDSPDSSIDAPTQIKFLYGHLLEELLLFFVRLSGHTVSDEQKEVTVNGIKGHMDCKIDGQVVDIKTASSYAFRKFSEGTLADQDDFGYLSQLAGYEEAEGTDNGGFLVINKESGALCLYQPDDMDKPNVKERIKYLKSSIKLANPPERCYNPIPEGAKGNEKLPRPCTYCPHKFKCYADANDGEGLRTFKYSKGPMYLTKVVVEPRVEEI